MIQKLIWVLLMSPLAIIAQKTTVELETFNEIKVYDAISVNLIRSNQNKAVITGDDVNQVAIVNKDGRLKVRMEIDNMLDGKDTKVTIYHSEKLNLIDANENATITSEDIIDSKYISIRVQEGAKIALEVKARKLDVKAVSGGKINVSGTVPNQDVVVRTGGRYYGEDLKTKQTDVTVFAGGEAFIHSDEFVEANVTAGGTIEIYGNPENVKEDKTFGGAIVIRK
ncbi:head GIN domain-containing protein [Aquimarina spongiae]|uniref:Putative auto-transporter adhesin, head GIN domain n=1 Tax=Aquimarina spongiae TaxID=570521 RepID=A0A1M6GNM2_9FLAO|nr:head GIN domain-containing protein [Aquimarina spongiae]SHJ11561.1 Putative auto-transporter adhesin, head GIN domain [Aquimarina spongiae]